MADKRFNSLLQGAYDIHVHCSPDVIGRAEDIVGVAKNARNLGMAGMLIKDHTTSTAGRVYAVNKMASEAPRLFSALALNPAVGLLNPVAVEAALLCGTDAVYFPT